MAGRVHPEPANKQPTAKHTKPDLGPAPYVDHGDIRAYWADCLDHMRGMPDGSVDAVVTDPPYSLAFMGRAWDTHTTPQEFQAWCEQWARECLRVVRPGGHLAAFGGTRTFHRLACGIEDAGWQPWDSISTNVYQWNHGQGFPKGKAQLKPAWEPIVLARKPASRVEPLNIDACRLATSTQDAESMQRANSPGSHRMRAVDSPIGTFGRSSSSGALDTTRGRWPTNVVLAHAATAVYRLRHDVPDEIAESIRAYYRAREAVRVLRDGVPGDADRAGEAPVLQPGVWERGPSRGADDDLGVGDVPAVRGNVPDDARVGAQRSPEELREDLPLGGEQGQHEPAGQGAHAGVPGADGQEPRDAGALVAVEGRELPLEGLPLRPDRDAATGDDRDRATDGPRGHEVRDGAPGDRSRAGGSAADAGRRRAPRQRGEDGQPAGEPRRDAASGPHAGAPGVRASIPGSADRGGDAENGEQPLDVRAGDLPDEWLPFFDYVGVVDVCVGPDEAPGPCVPGCQVAALDEQGGIRRPGERPANREGIGYHDNDRNRSGTNGERVVLDAGGASRFFPTFRYQAKAPKRERPEAWGRHVKCTCLVSRPLDPETGALPPWHRRGTVCATCERPAQLRGHSTVKPQGLLRWLVDLLVVPGGTVLDPFAGSGSTLEAARLEGFAAIGIEADEHSCKLISARLAKHEPTPDLPPLTLFDGEAS